MAPVASSEAQSMKPNYEVKLQLDPLKVLSIDTDLTSAIRDSFGVSKPVNKMDVQFLDTCPQELYAAGWSLRMRCTDKDSDLELNYKKRYKVEEGGVDAALAEATKDGLIGPDSNYEAQVEWGYSQETLSISRDKGVSPEGSSKARLPGTIDSRQILIDKAPDKFDNWRGNKKWGTRTLKAAGIYGPLHAKRWVGRLGDEIKKLFIEVWPVRNDEGTGFDYIVEVSFKADDRKEASEGRDKLIEHLGNKEWLILRDALKTSVIIARYACPRFLGTD